MSGFSIVCAWKDLGDPYRQRAFEFTRRYWAHVFPDAELIVGMREPFTRARGLNAAVEVASTSMIVQADPDSVAPVGQIIEALELAASREGLVIPYSSYYYLNEESTAALHALPLGEVPLVSEADCQFCGVGGCGPISVFSRATWEKAHGYDERFGLWGGDDGAFACACDAFCGIETRTIAGPMFHSYHPRLPQSIPGGVGYGDQYALLSEYLEALNEGGREAVRAHVLNR